MDRVLRGVFGRAARVVDRARVWQVRGDRGALAVGGAEPSVAPLARRCKRRRAAPTRSGRRIRRQALPSGTRRAPRDAAHFGSQKVMTPARGLRCIVSQGDIIGATILRRAKRLNPPRAPPRTRCAFFVSGSYDAQCATTTKYKSDALASSSSSSEESPSHVVKTKFLHQMSGAFFINDCTKARLERDCWARRSRSSCARAEPPSERVAWNSRPTYIRCSLFFAAAAPPLFVHRPKEASYFACDGSLGGCRIFASQKPRLQAGQGRVGHRLQDGPSRGCPRRRCALSRLRIVIVFS